ncbi:MULTISPECIES: hypothetical protein [Halobacillus]|uniref:hypothetical protein n=1 Tax=Halobacillus TaxID=45667 RepID=UPI001371CE54|nr:MULTISPECIES: hypothetical protein [Halobacillus]MYL31034.1 hypothetical protein [Halobacillus halophilus]MYL39343.1 hypothetical protein [Halobacillus litoralis]
MAEEDVQRFIKQWLVEKLKQKKSARRADDQSFIFLEEDSLKLLFLYLIQKQEERGTVEKTADLVEVESMMEELLIQLEEVSALLDNENGDV